MSMEPGFSAYWLEAATLVSLALGAGILLWRRRKPGLSAYTRLIENLSDACVVISGGRIVAVNPAMQALLNQTELQLVGRDTYDVVTSLGAGLPGREEMRSRISREGSQRFEVPFQRRDGTRGVAELTVSEIAGHDFEYIAFVRDVTDRVAIQQRLRERDLQFSKAMQTMGLASWVYDVKTGEQFWSDEMATISGAGAEIIGELDGLPILSIIHPEDRFVAAIITKHLNAGEDPPPTSFRIVRPDGEIRHVEAHVGRLEDASGEPTHIVTLLKDITDEVDRAQQLRHALKMEAVGQLTGGLAHDFNNLLHVILGNAELVTSNLSDFDRSCLEAIRRSATRGSELTQRLLAFSRKQVLAYRSVSANDSIDQMIPLLERTLGAGVSIETTLDPELPRCHTDAGQLENCILNLALNAQHAMPEGGTLTIETAAVDLDDAYARRHGEVVPGRYVEIKVTDTGVGMSHQVAQRVFEPFFTTREAGKGSGLGLSMVFGFVKQCRGHVSISSREGEGTTVRLYLPVDENEPAAVDPVPAHVERTFEGKVLLVEDDQQVLELTARLLGGMGFDVVTARDANSAHRVMQDHESISLLVTDVMLPGGVNGPAIGETFRQRFADSPVLYMSGYTENAIVDRGILEQGAILVSKPFQRQVLQEKIQQALGESEVSRGGR
ncbi:MAG: PAS domain S-box protein [Pseudomonadales bacterium]|nr:PAS domain S-box protein [Pseudomonadales bacterium]